MDWKGKKIIIVGVSGFIGSNITKKFIELGADIYAIDNFSYIDAEISKSKNNFWDKIHLIEGDVSDKKTWENMPKDIEYIFYFGSPSSITLFKRTPEKCYYETVFGLYNALEFAKINKIKKLVYPTSGSNYAGNVMPHREDIYIRPRNLYAAAKMACEGLASSYSDFVKIVGLRLFAGYGPGEEWKKDFGSVLYLFIKDIMDNKAPVIWGDGSQTRDFVYVEDFVRAIVRAAEIDYTGVINVGTGNPVSFNQLLEIINRKLGKNIKAEYVNKELNYVEDLKADTILMKELLGFEAISTEDGVSKFIDYLKS